MQRQTAVTLTHLGFCFFFLLLGDLLPEGFLEEEEISS
jgi:hypothetical protein